VALENSRREGAFAARMSSVLVTQPCTLDVSPDHLNSRDAKGLQARAAEPPPA
jgi:hypothetical protein